MKGLKEYIAKHGFHFTEELAYKAAGGKKWSADKIAVAAQKRVYYNVTRSTLGDMTYSTNAIYFCCNSSGYNTLARCITIMLNDVGCFEYFGYGGIFSLWLETMHRHGEEFDFTQFI